MTRAELIAKLEAAEGPSRELDAEIALACGWSRSGIKGNVWVPPGHEPWDCDKLPEYTFSLDEALTLVPDGHSWVIGNLPDAMVWRTGNLGAPFRASGATPAIAIVLFIAFLAIMVWDIVRGNEP